jgi:competence protein ComEA
MSLTSIVRSLAASAVVVALAGATALPARAEGDAPAQKVVNVNQAASTELARLPRVGPKLADRIVSHRGENGPFKRAEGLMEVKGIGEKMFATLKPYVAVSGPTTLTEKVSSAKSKGSGKGRGKRSEKTPESGK